MLSESQLKYVNERAEKVSGMMRDDIVCVMDSANYYWKRRVVDADNQADAAEKRANVAEKNVLEWQRRHADASKQLEQSQANEKQTAAANTALRQENANLIKQANYIAARIAARDSALAEYDRDTMSILRKHARKECKTMLDCAVDVTDQLAALKAFHVSFLGGAPIEFKCADLDDIQWHTVKVAFDG